MNIRLGCSLLVCGLSCLWANPASALFWRKGDGENKRAESVIPPAQLTVASPVSATTQRPHKVITGEDAEESLVRLATARQLREEELRVIQRLLNEKVAELERINAKLQEHFGVAPDRNYQYDRESNAIFELVPRGDGAAAGGDPTEGFDRAPHRELADETAAQQFLKQVGAKNITTGEIQYLRLLFREKEIEVSRVYTALEEEFSVLRDRHYEYDAEEKILYEIVPATDSNHEAVPEQ